mgnify:CR=1 FL=1
MDFDIIDNPILCIFVVVIGLILTLTVIILSIYAIDYYFIHNYNVEVTVDNHKVFEGRMACVDVNSAGATTTVTIKNGFLCMFPKTTYTNKEVTIK